MLRKEQVSLHLKIKQKDKQAFLSNPLFHLLKNPLTPLLPAYLSELLQKLLLTFIQLRRDSHLYPHKLVALPKHMKTRNAFAFKAEHLPVLGSWQDFHLYLAVQLQLIDVFLNR